MLHSVYTRERGNDATTCYKQTTKSAFEKCGDLKSNFTHQQKGVTEQQPIFLKETTRRVPTFGFSLARTPSREVSSSLSSLANIF